MAKVIGPLHSAEARGRMSGLIFNTWRGIATVKAFCSPAQPRSMSQLRIRSWTTQLVRAWGALEYAKILAWNAYAVNHPETDWTGNPKRLTGLNWYVRCNLRLLWLAETLITDPPAVPAPDPPDSFLANDGVGQTITEWTATDPGEVKIDIWFAGPTNHGVQPKIERAHHSTFELGETATVTITGLQPGYYMFFARMIDLATGLASTWVSEGATIT